MPSIDQYSLDHRELIEVLIKEAGVTEGKWALMVSFGFAVGAFGPTQDQVSPGVAVTVTKIGIQRVPADTKQGLLVDAALVSPPAKSKKRA